MQRLKKEEREPLPKILQDIFAQACPLLMAPAMGLRVFSSSSIKHWELPIIEKIRGGGRYKLTNSK